ncbi:hypothetical protein [Paenibacillus sp. JDR-2]|uniref:hypothetical protein n=1 Tax=Paenibacillus sp. (strain JDR-2) TaxID=324057 RepID=UPI0001666B5A|nr:hypothetical protein [Paenibacillus sp. JDR-2]ACT03168.1 hypothetical protein Pjdr2_4549 [Paenibacillus sp. JDR-2]
MIRNLISMLFILLAFIFVASLIGCSARTDSRDKTFEQSIDERLHDIVNPKNNKVSFSSNPYDYIKGEENNLNYKYIVTQGEQSLDYMLHKFASNDEDGLEEYIMAMACSEILKENPDDKKWASGREWYREYKQGSK